MSVRAVLGLLLAVPAGVFGFGADDPSAAAALAQIASLGLLCVVALLGVAALSGRPDNRP